MNLFTELKRRNVIRVAIAYAIAAWVVLQFTDVVAPILELPDSVSKFVLYALAIGFIPAVVFAWLYELTEDGIKKEKDVDRSESATHDTRRKLNFIIIAVLSFGILLLLFDKFTPSDVEIADKSIAVLPFVNMSSDEEQEYFSDGITEEILNKLASVKELRVAGRTSSFAFKGQNEDLRRIGDTLGVAHILEGSVRKSGDQVLITAQLVKVDDGFHLWSKKYERKLDDVFAIQDEIASEISRQLQARLLEGGETILTSQTTSAAAYELYLRARQRMYDRTRASLEDADRLLSQVIEQDANYAPAYAQRGVVSILLADDSYGNTPRAEADEQGKVFIDQALSIDADLPEGLAALGLYYSQVNRFEESITILQRSLSLNPNQLDTSLWLANALGSIGDEAGNLLVLQTLLDKDPLYRPAFGNAVQLLNIFGKTEEAAILIEKVRAFNPNDPQLIESEAAHEFFRGNVIEAYLFAEKAAKLAPDDFMANLMFSAGLAQTYQGDRLLNEGMPFFQVTAYDAVGRTEEAMSLAYELANDGNVNELFILLNRHNLSQELVDYLDEHWPSLEAFNKDHPAGRFGHGIMLMVAFAMTQTDDPVRFAKAIDLYETGMAKMRAMGIDNRFFNAQEPIYYAVIGDTEQAFALLTRDDAPTNFGVLPLAMGVPEMRSLMDDPRFAEYEQRLIDVMNADRAKLGLESLDPRTDFWPQFR